MRITNAEILVALEVLVASVSFIVGCWLIGRRKPVDMDPVLRAVCALGDTFDVAFRDWMEHRYPEPEDGVDEPETPHEDQPIRDWLSGRPFNDAQAAHIRWAWRVREGLEKADGEAKHRAMTVLARSQVDV